MGRGGVGRWVTELGWGRLGKRGGWGGGLRGRGGVNRGGGGGYCKYEFAWAGSARILLSLPVNHNSNKRQEGGELKGTAA
jgi:hypothetical protein